jgi:hypothetical protein
MSIRISILFKRVFSTWTAYSDVSSLRGLPDWESISVFRAYSYPPIGFIVIFLVIPIHFMGIEFRSERIIIFKTMPKFTVSF